MAAVGIKAVKIQFPAASLRGSPAGLLPEVSDFMHDAGGAAPFRIKHLKLLILGKQAFSRKTSNIFN
jgi:hypothetical protein